MPAFVEDPTKLSKSRLRSELVARSVGLPPAESRKEVYVELFLKHVDRENAADFSSDEEEPAHHAENKKRKDLDGAETPDPRGLTDDELKAALLQHGVKAGPIVGSTRALYERRLQKLLQSDVRPCVNGADDAVLYSDSEEEEEDEEEEEESDLEQAGQETLSHLEQTHEESCQRWEPSSRKNARNAVHSRSEPSRAHCSRIPTGFSAVSSAGQPLGSGVPPLAARTDGSTSPASARSRTFSITQLVEEMESQSSLLSKSRADLERWGVQEDCPQAHVPNLPKGENYTLKNETIFYTPPAAPYKQEIKECVEGVLGGTFPATGPSPTGIIATRRRPIKGAAGRPIQYKYPDPPASPLTREREEVERRLVPVYIQILVFVIVACLLYLVYACMEETSYNPFMSLLDDLSEEALTLRDQTQDVATLDSFD